MLLLLAAAAAITLGPLPVRGLDALTRVLDALTPGSPGWPDRHQAEAAGNLLLFVPLSVLLVVLRPQITVLRLLLACGGGSAKWSWHSSPYLDGNRVCAISPSTRSGP